MGNLFLPDVYLNRADDVPYEALYGHGWRTVLFDIDNTIVPHGFPADDHAIALFSRVREAGLKTVLISNNRMERVAPFAKAVRSPYLCKAGKPRPEGYRRAVRMAGGAAETTFFVGDQLFTDVLGANLAGLKTVLLRPIDPHEEIQIVLKRRLERPLLALYARRTRRRGYGAADVFERICTGREI